MDEKMSIEGSTVSLMAHLFDGPKKMYDQHTGVNQAHCLMHVFQESMNECFLFSLYIFSYHETRQGEISRSLCSS